LEKVRKELEMMKRKVIRKKKMKTIAEEEEIKEKSSGVRE